MRQELGAVGGCSTHLGGEGKYNRRDEKNNSAEGEEGGGGVVGRVHAVTVTEGVQSGLGS